MNERDITGRDERTLRVAEAGDPAGVPVLSLHGSPGSRLMWSGDIAEAAERGIRLISYDRPGYGGSDRHEGRNVADCAADVRAIADALGIRRLGVTGGSGGGPHAAACASLLSGLVPAVAVVASLAPWGAPGLDYFAGMGEFNVEDIRLQRDDPVAALAKAQREREELLAADLETAIEMFHSLLSPVDEAVFTSELGAFTLAQMKLGLTPGLWGAWDDGGALLADWGFGLSQIRTPVLLLHGRKDRFVPCAHGEWLAEAIPGVEARIYDDEGHLSLEVNRMGEVFDWLLERLR